MNEQDPAEKTLALPPSARDRTRKSRKTGPAIDPMLAGIIIVLAALLFFVGGYFKFLYVPRVTPEQTLAMMRAAQRAQAQSGGPAQQGSMGH